MKIMRKQGQYYSGDLTQGDVIDVAGMRCTVVEVEPVIRYHPINGFLRIHLRSDDYLGQGPDIVLDLGYGIPVKIRK